MVVCGPISRSPSESGKVTNRLGIGRLSTNEVAMLLFALMPWIFFKVFTSPLVALLSW
jgi:hypothetical protein